MNLGKPLIRAWCRPGPLVSALVGSSLWLSVSAAPLQRSLPIQRPLTLQKSVLDQRPLIRQKPLSLKKSLPLLTPPPPATNLGLPAIQYGRICPELQRSLQRVIGPQSGAWSVSVIDPRGQLLADINGGVARIPASNQKLITTAYALDSLGPDFRLRTRLIRRADGVLEISGEGDPDLSLAEIQRFAMVALNQGGSRSATLPTAPIKLLIREEPRQNWWPSDWHPADRAYAYGAPITRLALTSNALNMAVMNPVSRFQRVLRQELQKQGGNAQVQLINHNKHTASAMGGEPVVLHEEDSIAMHGLLSLANTESHNFTAEVLLREAADSWDLRRASLAANRWMQTQNLPSAGLRIADGSGLSRNNRVTSRTLAALLLRMGQHPLAAYYQASMAIAGQRGTLRNLYRGTGLQGRFWGKTGTLSGVRSISGILQTKDGPRYISMLANGAGSPNWIMGQLLTSTQALSPCPSLLSAWTPPAVRG